MDRPENSRDKNPGLAGGQGRRRQEIIDAAGATAFIVATGCLFGVAITFDSHPSKAPRPAARSPAVVDEDFEKQLRDAKRNIRVRELSREIRP